MYRLNCTISEDVEKYLKEKGKEYCCSMGTIVTMIVKQQIKEDIAINAMAMAKEIKDEGKPLPD